MTNVTIKKGHLSCARYKQNSQMKEQLNLRKIQTKQSNERTVKFAQDANKTIKMKEKLNLHEI